MIYFISDIHFGHEYVLRFGRPFRNIDEMDKAIMDNWNAVVGKDDDVYIVGDFWYKGEKPVKKYLQQLTGRKILIAGNHDSWWIQHQPEALPLFENVYSILEVPQEKPPFVLCHYPMLEWNGDRRGRYLIHGHTHSSEYLDRQGKLYQVLQDMPTALNACVDVNNFMPVSVNELIANNNWFYRRQEAIG